MPKVMARAGPRGIFCVKNAYVGVGFDSYGCHQWGEDEMPLTYRPVRDHHGQYDECDNSHDSCGDHPLGHELRALYAALLA